MTKWENKKGYGRKETLLPEKELKQYLKDKKEDLKRLVKLLPELNKVNSSSIKRPIEEAIATKILEEAESLKKFDEMFAKERRGE